jgi:hypothetical protein
MEHELRRSEITESLISDPEEKSMKQVKSSPGKEVRIDIAVVGAVGFYQNIKKKNHKVFISSLYKID